MAPPACVCLWTLGEPCSTHVSPQWQKNQTTCTHIWTHGSTGVKTNILLATREKTLVLVFSLFRRSPHVCYISARITIQFRVGCLCVIHTYVPGTVTNRHINTLQLCEILCKGNPQWEKLTAGTDWISLSLFVIMTQSVHSFLICICLLLFYIGGVGGGGYIYMYTVFTLQCKFLPANIFQRATKLWVFLLRMPLSLSPLSVLSTLLSALSSYTQRHLGDALTKRVPNECGKWEYQFDELCYSISAINFPVALLSKMESRMIEPLFRYLILFLGSCLRACRACVSESVCAKKREALVKERDF